MILTENKVVKRFYTKLTGSKRNSYKCKHESPMHLFAYIIRLILNDIQIDLLMNTYIYGKKKGTFVFIDRSTYTNIHIHWDLNHILSRICMNIYWVKIRFN